MVQTCTSLPKTHLPFVIDYFDGNWEITAEEGAGMILALQQRDRVRLQMVVPNSQKLIMAMDEEHPVLDHLVIVPSMEDKSTALILSDTLQPPHHRFMGLSNILTSNAAGKRSSQLQDVLRHMKDMHKPHSCVFLLRFQMETSSPVWDSPSEGAF